MDEDIRRAEQVMHVVRQRFIAEGLKMFTRLDSYEHGCMIYIDFFDEHAGETGDGLTLTVTARYNPIQVIEEFDFQLEVAELVEYMIIRARGATFRQALAAIEAARPKRARWWRRIRTS